MIRADDPVQVFRIEFGLKARSNQLNHNITVNCRRPAVSDSVGAGARRGGGGRSP